MDPSFGKFYAKTFDGSMYGAGPVVFAVWGYCIAKARPPMGVVELNPELLAHTIGGKKEDIILAIEYLEAPDTHSRSKNSDGKRIERLGQFEYRLVNFISHREGTDSEARKEYWRKKQREYRLEEKKLSNNVKQDVFDKCLTITQAEAEAEAEVLTLHTAVCKGVPETPVALSLPVDNSPTAQGMTIEEAKASAKVQWRPTIELLMAVSRRSRIPKEELLYLDRLDEIHTMQRVQAEIIDQKKRFLARCTDLCGLTLGYLYDVLRHQRTNTGRKTVRQDAADLRRVAPTKEKLSLYERAGKTPEGEIDEDDPT